MQQVIGAGRLVGVFPFLWGRQVDVVGALKGSASSALTNVM